jgi:hypothetical protein
MAEIYTYHAEVFVPVPSVDLTGFDVDATDGHIGKVDEASYETGSSCLVVDTGFWIFGKKRMIPAAVVQRVDPDERKVFVAMTKEQIKDAPDYDEQRHRDDEQGHHDENASYYEQHATDRASQR